jgi:hypothetical protein
MHSFVAELVAATSDPFPDLPYRKFRPPIIVVIVTIKMIGNAPDFNGCIIYLPPCFIHSSILKKTESNVNGFY